MESDVHIYFNNCHCILLQKISLASTKHNEWGKRNDEKEKCTFLTIRNSDLRYPPCYCWGSKSSGLLRHVFGYIVPEVSKNHTAFILRVMSQLRTYNLKVKALVAFETSWRNYQSTGHNNSKDLLPQYENRFVRNKISQCCVVISG
jgi:hypothetical protein